MEIRHRKRISVPCIIRATKLARTQEISCDFALQCKHGLWRSQGGRWRHSGCLGSLEWIQGSDRVKHRQVLQRHRQIGSGLSSWQMSTLVIKSWRKFLTSSMLWRPIPFDSKLFLAIRLMNYAKSGCKKPRILPSVSFLKGCLMRLWRNYCKVCIVISYLSCASDVISWRNYRRANSPSCRETWCTGVLHFVKEGN